MLKPSEAYPGNRAGNILCVNRNFPGRDYNKRVGRILTCGVLTLICSYIMAQQFPVLQD
ncbi:hypothetical protein METBIDRAFT_31246 [Metschnikowia bicuspidata var. bicuspidata NRRL YB-4993]|uniref:Uncharacterized protein n=1 Tax=Metschnikowia bicuspidata var. bicuspidata NRRL YB-4993 TaxID=869754 RepID=A0A1A0HEJ7_9ASCO|nr:hypothetical protein METBIDRAFT_31246 [Metschnikowia bicuspidata var. bicuspidata NRRL YB-4993]OBA22328.1 hypothetical protein METBIDRAFT_31246 [Metschnikowia bicuspidata var. bicuspidata NRRL YB-4993]